MKEGLSGSIINEMEVNERWSDYQEEARQNLQRVKALEKNNPKPYFKNGIGYYTEGFKKLAGELMEKRSKERFKRNE